MNRRDEVYRTGVSLNREIVDKLNGLVDENFDLGVSRSDIINCVLWSVLSRESFNNQMLRSELIKFRNRIRVGESVF